MSLSPSNLALENVVAGCLRNDRRAQEVLYKRYFDSLFSIAYAYSGKDEEVVKILHDSFLKIFQHISEFDANKSSMYSWMRTIVVGTAIDLLRRSKNYFPLTVWLAKYDPVIDPELMEQMSKGQIIEMLNGLSDVTRIVFNLFVTEGYSHNEIGILLNIKESTSKWHLNEAGIHLINSLKERKSA